MPNIRKQLGIGDGDSASIKPIIHFEQLEPRIMLSGDSLLSSALNRDQDAILDDHLEVVQEAELLYIEDQVEEQIEQEPFTSETADDEVYKPICTLLVGDENNDKSADEDLNVDDYDPAPIGDVLAVISSIPVAEIDSEVIKTQDSSMPIYENDVDLSKECATSIEIRGPPVSNCEYSTTSTLSTNATSDGFNEDSVVESISQLNIPDLPGLKLVDHNSDNLQGQVIYLDFDGAEDAIYNGPVLIGPFSVSAFEAPGELAGQEQVIIHHILGELNQVFARSGVVFTTEKPADGQIYSTVFIGGDDTAYGAKIYPA